MVIITQTEIVKLENPLSPFFLVFNENDFNVEEYIRKKPIIWHYFLVSTFEVLTMFVLVIISQLISSTRSNLKIQLTDLFEIFHRSSLFINYSHTSIKILLLYIYNISK